MVAIGGIGGWWRPAAKAQRRAQASAFGELEHFADW
jgi:hypothetical protein